MASSNVKMATMYSYTSPLSKATDSKLLKKVKTYLSKSNKVSADFKQLTLLKTNLAFPNHFLCGSGFFVVFIHPPRLNQPPNALNEHPATLNPMPIRLNAVLLRLNHHPFALNPVTLPLNKAQALIGPL